MEKLRILLTNDDGIGAEGLIRLARAALSFGEVWVAAPDGQRSAASHSITLHAPIDVYPVSFPVEGVTAFSCSGTPGDCVRVGMLRLLPEKPDLVLSGINYGYNTASDIQYSATVGAAMEAEFQGRPAIALSEGACACHEVTDAYLMEVLEKWIPVVLRRGASKKGQILNVNFPGCKAEACRGILEDRRVSEGTFYRDQYNVMEELADGGLRLMVHGNYNEDAEGGTDFRAVVDHYVSVGWVNNIGYGPVIREAGKSTDAV